MSFTLKLFSDLTYDETIQSHYSNFLFQSIYLKFYQNISLSETIQLVDFRKFQELIREVKETGWKGGGQNPAKLTKAEVQVSTEEAASEMRYEHSDASCKTDPGIIACFLQSHWSLACLYCNMSPI